MTISEKEVTSLQEDCPCFAAVSGNGFSNASPIPIIDQKNQEIQMLEIFCKERKGLFALF